MDSTQPPGAARVLLVASGKGGTGKTTLALALAHAWAATGLRVALVDADPQAGTTTAAGLVPVADPLTADPSPAHGLLLYPAGRTLSGASPDAHAARVRRAAETAELVVVDASPSLTDAAHEGALGVAALVLVAARTDAAGLPSVAETVAAAEAVGVPVRVVPTFTAGTGLARESHAFLRGRYGDRVTAAAIPQDARAAEAAGVGRPVTLTAPRSRVAEALRVLAEELLPALLPARTAALGGLVRSPDTSGKGAAGRRVRSPDNGAAPPAHPVPGGAAGGAS